ncbi:Cas10/Cmr2 second palm domain-containing protein [Heliophilum fasciatum]|uniref:Cas10/Cmr2 second palm domain-containing protein n=1 Tax=Heliophilum fasciatum TaxID=35700 RepID=A0A4R2RML2_9FIRM|nr:hypothetical protein [Heliophilum fasciatum]MCW2279304.1 hypothetical protein [Heliophilum fasciatum]TCP60435.1 hypothetical protein EDD73_13817 [Heliophilum fasciatum]
MNQILVISDTNNIYDYLFSSAKYKYIRGASIILDELNRVTTRKIVDDCGGQLLTVGGGESRALFASAENAEKYVCELKKAYLEATGQVTLTTAIVARDHSESIHDWFSRAERLLRFKEVESDKKAMSSTGLWALVQRCEVCKKQAVEVSGYSGTKANASSQRICPSCKKKLSKIKQAKETLRELADPQRAEALLENIQSSHETAGLMDIHYRQIKRFLERKTEKGLESTGKLPRTWVEDLQTLLESESGDGSQYIGFIYADGRNIGNFFREKILKKYQGESLEKNESLIIKDYIKNSSALHDATMEAAMRTAEEFEQFHADYAMIGGDDFVAIVPGKYAVAYANTFLKHFNEVTASTEYLGHPQNMTAGIVIAKQSYPIRRLFDLSNQLMAQAKKKKKFQNNSVVDFMVITDTTVQSIEKIRANEQAQIPGRQLRAGGYAISGDEPDTLEKLSSTIKKLKELNFPRSKIKDVYHIARMSDTFNMEFYWVVWRSRLEPEIRRIFDEWNHEFHRTLFPFEKEEKPFTTLLDLFDLYDYFEV